MTDGEETDPFEEADYYSHPSLSLALEEVRNRYEDVEDRRRTVESKIGTVISVNAIVISLVGIFSSFPLYYKFFVSSFALVSVALGLWAIRPRDYHRPGVEVEELFGEAQKNPSTFEVYSLNDYRDAIENNKETNDERYNWFRICSVLTFFSLTTILLGYLLYWCPLG
jgi:hypothetical protein